MKYKFIFSLFLLGWFYSSNAQTKQQIGLGVGEMYYLKETETQYFDSAYYVLAGYYKGSVFGNLSRYDVMNNVNMPAVYYDVIFKHGWRLGFTHQLTVFKGYNTALKFIGPDAPALVTDTIMGKVNRFKLQMAKDIFHKEKWQLYLGTDLAIDWCSYKRNYHLEGGGWGYVNSKVKEKRHEGDIRVGLVLGTQYQFSKRYSVIYEGGFGVGLPAGGLGYYKNYLHRLSVQYTL